MREVTRICNRKNILLLFLLCFINMGILILCADTEKQITLTGEELEAYLQEYPDFLERTHKSGSIMSKLQVYQSGFSGDHVRKVTAHYQSLGDVKVAAGDNRGIILLLQYRLTDIFQLIFLFMIVMDFFKERKKGLVSIVRSTPRGRGILFLQRMGILALATFFSTILLYGCSFLSLHFTFGIHDLSRSLQSLPEFMKCPYPLRISEYLLFALLLKYLGSLLAGVLLYIIMGIFSYPAALTLSGAFLLLQLFSALLLEPVSSINHLRYLNIYTLLRAEDYFTDCIYLNLFGHAVSALKCMLFLVLGLLLLLTLLGFVVHGKMYIPNSRKLEQLLEAFHHFVEKHAWQRTLHGWEIYKLYFKQGAFFLIAALLFLQIHLCFQYNYYYPVDAMERLSYLKYYGDLTDEKLADAEYEMSLLKEAESRLRDNLAAIESAPKYNDYKHRQTQLALENNLKSQVGLQPVIDDMKSAFAYQQETGRQLQIIQPYTYDLLIQRDIQPRRRAAFLELILIIGSLSGIYAHEKQNHMGQMIHSTFRGRNMQHMGKPLLATGFSIITTLLLHGVQMLHIGLTMGFNDLNAPIQSLSFMRAFPLFLSIGGYLILVFFLRILAAVVLGFLMLFLSHICSDKLTAVGLGVGICILLWSLSGFLPGLDFLNPLFLLSADYLC